MATARGDKFDFVIFGASGYTGVFVVEQMVRVANGHSWAVAGRSESKLKQTLNEVSRKTGKSLNDVEMIVADVADYDSLVQMTKVAKVVLNCVGPYRWYGEPVVKACIENGASHVDISGESQYVESMALKYQEAAKQAGVYIVSSCGWDSIPCDLGVQYAIKQFQGHLDSIETVAEFNIPKGTKLHYGTYQTMIYMIAKRHELDDIRKAQNPEPLPKSNFKPQKRSLLFRHEGANNGWCLPFTGTDIDVVTRTTQYNYSQRNLRPVQVKTYLKAPSLGMALGFGLWGPFFFAMSSCKLGRWLLLKNPKFFSAGMFSHEGPSKEQVESTTFRMWVFGKGWSGTRLGQNEQPTTPPTDTIVCAVDGGDPGYISTSACLVAAAFTILEENDKLPAKGGVYSPGAAFTNTKIYERLGSWGVTFRQL